MILTGIILPLSLPVIAVMILWYTVGHWNSYFSALIYLCDRADIGVTIKYATIIVSTLPILLIYPFLQKYFVHGVLIGALKE